MAGTGATSIRSYNYYFDGVILGTGIYAENLHDFIDVDDGTHFRSHSIVFSNDGAADFTFRYTPDPGGGAPHGRVRAGETLQMDFRREMRVYIAGVPGIALRVWAW